VDVDSEDEHKAEEEIEVSITGIISVVTNSKAYASNMVWNFLWIFYVSCTASVDICGNES